MPLEVSRGVAAFVVHPKSLLIKKGEGYELKPTALSTSFDGELVLTANVHGFAGNAGEYNERIRSHYTSPLRRDASEVPTLPPLITGTTAAGLPAPFITTAEPVPYETTASLLTTMNAALNEVNGDRKYELVDDMMLVGQQQATTHVALLRRIWEPAEDGTRRERVVVDLTATKGANRSIARQTLFGLKPFDVVFGVRPQRALWIAAGRPMGQEPPPETPIPQPERWVPALAELLRKAYEDPTHYGHHAARNATLVAVVPMQIVVGLVGKGKLEDFHSSVFDSNRGDHRRPPLEYRLIDRAAADFRALLRAYKTDELLDEAKRAWLAGEGPDPDARPRESFVDARDRRDHELFGIVFPPPDSDQARLARRVLSEPSRTQTQSKHVNNRLRMFAAAVTDGYTTRWNPRVLDGALPANAIRTTNQVIMPTWKDVRSAAADNDFGPLGEFLRVHGINWLADAGLVEADRGSIGAQAAGGDDDPDADSGLERQVRRTMSNYRLALMQKPRMAFGLLSELAHAAELNLPAREVDEHGNPVEGTAATRHWLNTTFPKNTGRKPRASGSGMSDPTPPAPPPAQPVDPATEHTQAQARFVEAVTDDLVDVMAEIFRLGENLTRAGDKAGVPPLAGSADATTEALSKALVAVRADIMSVMALLTPMTYGGATASDFQSSQSAKYAEEAAE
ncbi:hypothetical protein ADL03_06775 [Nocardia sp. NRRL S-836]|nr:hypothetical protein ADL03_06775 [Nocardia sp. NRRL S-836]